MRLSKLLRKLFRRPIWDQPRIAITHDVIVDDPLKPTTEEQKIKFEKFFAGIMEIEHRRKVIVIMSFKTLHKLMNLPDDIEIVAARIDTFNHDSIELKLHGGNLYPVAEGEQIPSIFYSDLEELLNKDV